MVLQQYQGGTHGLMVQAKRARSLEMPSGGVGSMAQTAQGGYVPSSLQLSAALVQPSGSPGLLLDSKHVIAPPTFAGARGAGGMYGAQLQGIVPRGVANVPGSEAIAGPLNAPVRVSSVGECFYLLWNRGHTGVYVHLCMYTCVVKPLAYMVHPVPLPGWLCHVFVTFCYSSSWVVSVGTMQVCVYEDVPVTFAHCVCEMSELLLQLDDVFLYRLLAPPVQAGRKG